jgi:Tol biopolymer transport system component
VPAWQWDKSGHHINFFPDGRHLSMNLNIDRDGMRFVRCNLDGTELNKILDDVPGSGHPTVHPDGKHILTDAYAFEEVAFSDGTIPLRWIDLEAGTEQTLLRIHTVTPYQENAPALRVDPHPAWDRNSTRVAFNAFEGGTRRVFIADLSGLVM